MFSAAQLSDRLQYLGAIEVQNEMNVFPTLYEVVAVARFAKLRVVECKASRAAQQKSLDVARGLHLERRRTSGDHERAAGIHFNLDRRWLRRRLLPCRLRLDPIAAPK